MDGHIYELDGRKKSPINHGVCDPSELLKVQHHSTVMLLPVSQQACVSPPTPSVSTTEQKAAKVVQEFMDRDAGEMRFAITAMCPNTD